MLASCPPPITPVVPVVVPLELLADKLVAEAAVLEGIPAEVGVAEVAEVGVAEVALLALVLVLPDDVVLLPEDVENGIALSIDFSTVSTVSSTAFSILPTTVVGGDGDATGGCGGGVELVEDTRGLEASPACCSTTLVVPLSLSAPRPPVLFLSSSLVDTDVEETTLEVELVLSTARPSLEDVGATAVGEPKVFKVEESPSSRTTGATSPAVFKGATAKSPSSSVTVSRIGGASSAA